MKIRSSIKSGVACYTVQKNDSLSKIAMNFCGNALPSTVNRIYYSNLATIGPNKNLIIPGQKLYIPDC